MADDWLADHKVDTNVTLRIFHRTLLMALWPITACAELPPAPVLVDITTETQDEQSQDENQDSTSQSVVRNHSPDNNRRHLYHGESEAPSSNSATTTSTYSTTSPKSACMDRRNGSVSIGGQRFLLDGWSDRAWAKKRSPGLFTNYVVKVKDRFVFLKGRLVAQVVVAGKLFNPLNMAFDGDEISLKFKGIYDNVYSHPMGRLVEVYGGYTLNHFIDNQPRSIIYDAEFQFGYAGACLAQYRNQLGLLFSGGEPLLVLQSIDNISYYQLPNY